MSDNTDVDSKIAREKKAYATPRLSTYGPLMFLTGSTMMGGTSDGGGKGKSGGS